MNKLLIFLLTAAALALPFTAEAQVPAAPTAPTAQPEQAKSPFVGNTQFGAQANKAKKPKKKKLKKKSKKAKTQYATRGVPPTHKRLRHLPKRFFHDGAFFSHQREA